MKIIICKPQFHLDHELAFAPAQTDRPHRSLLCNKLELPPGEEHTTSIRSSNNEINPSFTEQLKHMFFAVNRWANENGLPERNRFNEGVIDGVLESISTRGYGRLPHVSDHVFESLKIQLEEIYYALNDPVRPKDELHQIANNLLSGINVCGPGIITKVDDTHSACYSSSTLSYWLANLRTIIVKQLSEEHIKSKRINDGNSIHVHNAFYKYASDNNWNLLFHQNQLKDIFYELANLEENDLSRIYDSFRQRYQEEACSYVVQCFRDAVDSLIKKTGVNVGTDNAPSFIISNEQYPEFSKEIQNLFREIGINELSFWSIVTLNDDEILSVQDSFLKHIESFVLYGLYFQKKIIKGEEVEREAVEGKSNNSMDDQEKKIIGFKQGVLSAAWLEEEIADQKLNLSFPQGWEGNPPMGL